MFWIWAIQIPNIQENAHEKRFLQFELSMGIIDFLFALIIFNAWK